MARFADYVKEDQLETELADATKQEEVRETESQIPDRFKGKSLEDVVKSYVELERLNSRQAQDLGAMRKTVDTLLELQPDKSGSQASQTEEPSEPVTVDALYENPEEAIRRVVRKETTGQIKEVRKDLERERFLREQAKFDSEHPGWREIAATPEFQNWATGTNFRSRILAQANQWDFEAADTLLGLYGEEQARSNKEAEAVKKEQKRQSDFRQASLESSGPVPQESVLTFSRSDLIKRKLAAKRGDAEQDQWLRVNADAILQAYADQRITD